MTENPPHGDYTEEAGPDTVRLERLLPGPVERIWAYLIDGEKRRKWLAGGDIDPTPGSGFELRFRHAELSAEPLTHASQAYEGAHRETVLAADPPHSLTISWSEGQDNADAVSEVTFSLHEESGGVRFIITHRKLPSVEDKKDVSLGWHAHTAILEDRLAGREPRFFWAFMRSLKPVYDARYPGVKDFWDRQADKAEGKE